MLCYLEGILLITSELRSEFSYRLPIISRKLGNKYKCMIINLCVSIWLSFMTLNLSFYLLIISRSLICTFHLCVN